MDLGTGILGHQGILNFFTQVINNSALSHAYCFFGPEHVGKRTIAQTIAGKLLAMEQTKIRISPDVIFVERIPDEKTGKLKKDISIEQIRELIQRMGQSVFIAGGYKIAIIDGAEYLSHNAANALLKTLEDAKTRSIIFLIAHDETPLLPTILSRCQRIYFSPVPLEIIQKYLIEQGMSQEETEEYAKHACGLPGKAVEWQKEPQLFNEYIEEVNRFYSLRGRPLYEKIKSVEHFFDTDSDHSDHIRGRIQLRAVLDIWQTCIHDGLFVYNTMTAMTHDRIVALEHEIHAAKEMLAQNIHPRMLIENVLLQLP